MLWNFPHDKFLWLPRADGDEIIPYANDITKATQASLIIKAGELFEEATEVVVNWLTEVSIEMALKKTELIFFYRKEDT